MSTLTLDNPLPAMAGDFRWPDKGNTAFEPMTPARDACVIREHRIEFTNGLVFLRVNEVFVVVEPPVFSDAAMSALFSAYVTRVSQALHDEGLFVVTGTATLAGRSQRAGNSGSDEEFAVTLLREFILASIERRDATGITALNAYIFTTPAEESFDLFPAISGNIKALHRSMGDAKKAAGKPARKAPDLEFFKQLGIFLEHVNGNFLRVPVPAEIDALARAPLPRKRK
jgi:hypothetical protein